MIQHIHPNQENFRILLEYLIKISNDIKERILIIKNESYNSQEQRIQLEVLNKHLMPELKKVSSMVYSAILTHNKFPEKLSSLTNDDILKAQLALDDCVSILKSTGANLIMEFTMDDVFKD